MKKINFETGTTKDVIINAQDAKILNLKAGDRIIIKRSKKEAINNNHRIAILQIAYSDSIVSPGEIGLFIDTIKKILQQHKNPCILYGYINIFIGHVQILGHLNFLKLPPL